MKTTTIRKRLDKIYNTPLMGVLGLAKPSKNSVARRVVLDIINGTTASGYTEKETKPVGKLPYLTLRPTGRLIIRPVTTSGRGRHTSNVDRTKEITRLLDKLGLKYITGNDSPRGGKTGDFIRITTKIERP